MLNHKSDEELIQFTRSEDAKLQRDAMDALLSRYKEFVKTRTLPYFMMGADKDDLIQEGMIGLYKAILSFDEGKDSSFKTFADLCIRRQILTAVKLSTRMKHYPLNSSISLNSTVQSEDQEDQEMTLMDQLAADVHLNPENLYIGREERVQLEASILQRLSALELKVLGLYISGLNYHEIAKALHRPDKSIDNALQRDRKKANEILEKKD